MSDKELSDDVVLCFEEHDIPVTISDDGNMYFECSGCEKIVSTKEQELSSCATCKKVYCVECDARKENFMDNQ
jgi:acetyl-CoA carboxylase beta subunit